VEHGAVLHVSAVADADGVYISADDGIHPDRGTLTKDHVAENLGRGVNVTTGRDLGRTALVASDHLSLTFESLTGG
jgi:hypothetical protein